MNPNIKKFGIPTVIILIFGSVFISWYLNQQDFIQETALIFYQKYVQLNALLSENFIEGLKMLTESIQSESRNYFFALLLRPVYLLTKGSNAGYVFGIFLMFLLPAIFIISNFINKYILKDCQDIPVMRYATIFFVTMTPIFWFTVLVGYPDIFSLGLYVLAVSLFCKYPFDEKVPPKIILLFSSILYLAFLYRRWLLIAIISFFISAFIYLYHNF